MQIAESYHMRILAGTAASVYFGVDFTAPQDISRCNLRRETFEFFNALFLEASGGGGGGAGRLGLKLL